jgi:hypothetical protein
LELVDFALNVLAKAGPAGLMILFAWLWMDGRIISRGELKRIEEAHLRELKRAEDERDHARKEGTEWKFMAVRGTELAKFLGEKATAS